LIHSDAKKFNYLLHLLGNQAEGRDVSAFQVIVTNELPLNELPEIIRVLYQAVCICEDDDVEESESQFMEAVVCASLKILHIMSKSKR
jgi:hypothetical protein